MTSSCAASSGATTWAEDARDGIPTRFVAPPTKPARLTRLGAPHDALALEPDAAAERLEAALMAFGAARRRRGPQPSRAAAWPAEEIGLWRSLLDEIERAWAQPEDALPRRLLVQVRVVLEAEQDALLRRAGRAPPDIDRRVRRTFTEVARRLRFGTAAPGSEAPSRLVFRWPVSPIIVTSAFGYRRDPVHGDGRLGFHQGIDLAGARGDEIYASARGEVISTGWKGGLGKAVFVQHAGGFVSVYAHLSRILVKPNTTVDAETCVGLMGSTGRSTGAHLHFELHLGGTALDPLEHLDGATAPRTSRGQHPHPPRGPSFARRE